MIYLVVAATLLLLAVASAFFARSRPRAGEYDEMEDFRRAINALDRP